MVFAICDINSMYVNKQKKIEIVIVWLKQKLVRDI